ncbi:MAG: hypothetical protein WAU68_07455 [Vitreimonas sp.]
MLLDWSGAYQYIWPAPGADDADPLGVLNPDTRLEHEVIAACYAFLFPRASDAADRSKLASQAATFFALRNPSRTPAVQPAEIEDAADKLQPLWDQIISCANDPILLKPSKRGDTQKWWSAAMRLLIIADEASTGIGFHHEVMAGDTKPPDLIQTSVQVITYEKLRGKHANDDTVPVPTLCSELVSSDVVCVLPKTRTSQVGCTMRALTHNLAPIFSRGQVAAQWHISRKRPTPACEKGQSRGAPLNLLLVPFPYRIPSRCFDSRDQRYYFYTDQQPWLSNNDRNPQTRSDSTAKELCDFVESLCSVCQAGKVDIHGIVFPEYSLDWFTFDHISKELARKFASLEFVISGVSDTVEGDKGNFVATRGRLPWADQKNGWKPGAEVQWSYECTRGKHHPWILNNVQMQRYGVTHRFPERRDVLEHIQVGQRQIDFVEPRSGTSMTTLICEDLARIDPCQQVIRSVGPNLVIALLMDGPQILTRWPRHYAGVLADDPGSSVLTFSSFGLIERAAPTDSARSRAVAFWKDSLSEKELNLTSGSHALAVTLEATRIEETTLDRRGDGKRSYLWQLAQVQTVRARPGVADWILQGAGEF